MSESEQREWQEGLLQGYLWTDVLDKDGNVVAQVRTHEMTRPYASEPTPEGKANLAMVIRAPQLLKACKALLPLAANEACALDTFADSPEAALAARAAWDTIFAAQQLVTEAQP